MTDGTPVGARRGVEPMAGSRGESAGLIAVGAVGIATWLWLHWPWLAIAGLVVAALGFVSLAADLRGGRAWHRQDVMIRKLWAAAKRIPSDLVLADPETGELLTVERERRGWLTLAVTEPPKPDREAIVTRYLLGQRAPNPPPLHRHLGGLDDVPAARQGWRQRSAAELFARQTGAMEVTADELAALAEQVARAEVPARP